MSPRCVTFLLSGNGTRFTLDAPVSWSVTCGDAIISSGSAACCSVTVEGLKPDTEYLFSSDFGDTPFKTPHCDGLIDLQDLGLGQTGTNSAEILATAFSMAKPGQTLLIPAGNWETAPLQLLDGVTLHLAHGARIMAKDSRENWEILPAFHSDGRCFGSWEGQPADSYAAIIWATDANNITITGRGTIDGGGDRGDWWSWPKETRNGARRPRTLYLSNCDNVHISGITICNSPSWTLHPIYCDNLTVCGVSIKNPADSPNTDGLNPESCKNVVIEGCEISVGDDCIAVKAGKTAPSNAHLAPTQNLSIRQCRFADGHGGVVLGSEMSGSITEVKIQDCEFDGTDRGLRIKTRRDRGGEVANISMSHCIMNNVGVVLAVNAHYFCDIDGRSDHVQSQVPAPVTDGTPHISNISIGHLRATQTRIAFAAVLGLPEAPVLGVTLEHIAVDFAAATEPQPPLMASNIEPQSGAGTLCENAVITCGAHITPDTLSIFKPLRKQ